MQERKDRDRDVSGRIGLSHVSFHKSETFGQDIEACRTPFISSFQRFELINGIFSSVLSMPLEKMDDECDNRKP